MGAAERWCSSGKDWTSPASQCRGTLGRRNVRSVICCSLVCLFNLIISFARGARGVVLEDVGGSAAARRVEAFAIAHGIEGAVVIGRAACFGRTGTSA